MARKKTDYFDQVDKIKESGKSFDQLIVKVPMEQFSRMVMKLGLPANEARELCKSFKELKA